MSRTVTIRGPAMPTLYGMPALEFQSLSGHESLSSLFQYTATLRTPDSRSITEHVAANIPIKRLVGTEMTVTIELDGMGEFIPGMVGNAGMSNIGQGTREISGLVTQARFLQAENRRGIYEVTLEPWLTLATRTTDYKIFQEKTALEIIGEVLADYTYPVDFRTRQTYPPRTYQVQYGETDFAFISRLMEEWGLYYFFEHSHERHRLVVVDDVGAHKPFTSEAYHTLRYYPPGHKTDAEHINHFLHDESLQPGQWATSDFDFKKPRADLGQTVSMPRNTGHNQQEIYRWPGDYLEREEGRMLARVRMEEAGAPGFRAHARGNLRGVVTGCTFALVGYPQDVANIEYLVLGATLSITDNGHASGEGMYTVDTGFHVQPANHIFRAPQRHPKPRTTGPQTAIVTGPKGKEIWTDKYGRVKVGFHWNRYCTKDENSSCWIRVSYPWAGQNYAGIHLPRIGQEVIVDFENGDPDRPIITGRVYNGINLPPWALSGNQALSGFRSKELYGQRNNHLVLDDSEGQIQAQLSSDHALSQLNLGSITRIPDTSGRADRRGEGFELRTDAHGVVRAGAGMLLTTETRSHAASHVKSMGETLARLEAAQEAHAALADLARQHEAQTSGEQDAVSERLKRQNQALQGEGAPNTESGHFPEFAAPHLVLSSPAGIEATTAGSTHLASDKDLALTTGGNAGIASGKGLFASVKAGIKLFAHKLGIRLVAAHDDIDLHALKKSINLLAQLSINATSEKITLSATKQLEINGGGSYLRFLPEGIEAGTNGYVKVHRSRFSMTGPNNLPVGLPLFPQGICKECLLRAVQSGLGLVKL